MGRNLIITVAVYCYFRCFLLSGSVCSHCQSSHAPPSGDDLQTTLSGVHFHYQTSQIHPEYNDQDQSSFIHNGWVQLLTFMFCLPWCLCDKETWHVECTSILSEPWPLWEFNELTRWFISTNTIIIVKVLHAGITVTKRKYHKIYLLPHDSHFTTLWQIIYVLYSMYLQ